MWVSPPARGVQVIVNVIAIVFVNKFMKIKKGRVKTLLQVCVIQALV